MRIEVIKKDKTVHLGDIMIGDWFIDHDLSTPTGQAPVIFIKIDDGLDDAVYSSKCISINNGDIRYIYNSHKCTVIDRNHVNITINV